MLHLNGRTPSVLRHIAIAIIALAHCDWASAETALIDRAFERMAERPAAPWSFRQTTTDKKEVLIERCDHDGEVCAWTLISVNGKPPDDKRRERYAKRKAKALTEKRGESKNRFATLVEPGSISLISESDDRAVYRFTPLSESEDDRKINEQLEGTLVINKTDPYVESFQLKNNGPLAVAPLVKMHTMHIEMHFAPVKAGGPFLPTGMESNMRGKIGGLKKIEEQKRIMFDGYAF